MSENESLSVNGKENENRESENYQQEKHGKFKISGSVIFVLLIIAIGIIIGYKLYLNSLPVKIDISMTNYSGDIDYILDELDLDFDLVTMGTNCLTGVQKGEFKTEKYGILHTEFRYCKSNSTKILRVYNTTDDQRLREPKDGEIPKFDKYGKLIEGGK